MEQKNNYGDIRQTAFCAYCGGLTDTRDHVPSKVFLDEPYPTNLPVVPACRSCNEDFSLDEEYLACLLECVLAGSVMLERIERDKVRRILKRKPALVARLQQRYQKTSDGVAFAIENDRVKKVVLKLARGHAAFELNEPRLDDPSQLTILPFPLFNQEELERFQTPPKSLIFPEVGSRAMQRLVIHDPGASVWITAQPDRYRYLACVNEGVTIRMVIREYLACEVIWT